MLEVNAWIRATYGSDVIDFYAAIVASNGWVRPEVASGDGVHPNRYGQMDLADAVPLARIA
jgi:lysophospholipase L1-like esterase